MRFEDLFKPKPEWKHPDWMVRLAALEKFSDQVLLAEITKNNKDRYVRAVAQMRLQELKNK